MTVVFKYKGEELSFGYLYELESPFVKYCEFVLKDLQNDEEIEMKVLPGQLNNADIEEAKGLEPLIGRILYKIDCHLRKEVSFDDFLGWDKELCWNWVGGFSEDDMSPLVMDLHEEHQDVITLAVVGNPSDVRFSYTVKSKSRKSGKKTVPKNVSLSTIGLEEKAIVFFDANAIKDELEKTASGEGKEGKAAFLQAMGRLQKSSDFHLLHDFAKAKFAHALSKRFRHEIQDPDEAYGIIKDMKIFVSNDITDLDGVSLHDMLY
ncbi:hypothetical protein KZO25_15245 [Halomonas sp. ANAO-440]|uniref:hypothetical protein n=1 Tax=Halomonas sp. ANAO-440 TaxID=2861360 RepID=UPI001CAA4604|nr:hypothetical protein [Halomonas sp. ANAO-440]MBZ0331671.1 hypothetical protein [Halomonas sp. ANAO-440]